MTTCYISLWKVCALLTSGMDLDISEVSTLTRQALSHLLDAPDRLGKDWCLLAVKMGLTDKVRLLLLFASMSLDLSYSDLYSIQGTETRGRQQGARAEPDRQIARRMGEEGKF